MTAGRLAASAHSVTGGTALGSGSEAMPRATGSTSGAGDPQRGEPQLAGHVGRAEQAVARDVVRARRTGADRAQLEGLAHVVLVHQLEQEVRHRSGDAHGQRGQGPTGGTHQRREQRRDVGLGPDGVRPDHDRRPQQVQVEPGQVGHLLGDAGLELGLLLGVEQVGRRAGRPVLVHAQRVVGVEAVRRDRRGVHEPPRPGRARGAEGVDGAVDVDLAGDLARRGAGDEEGEVDDHVGPVEGLLEGGAVADVAAPVLHLRPAVLGRVERAAGDADDAPDPVVGLQPGHEAEAERAGGSGDRDRQRRVGPAGGRALALGRALAPGRALRAALGRRVVRIRRTLGRALAPPRSRRVRIRPHGRTVARPGWPGCARVTPGPHGPGHRPGA